MYMIYQNIKNFHTTSELSIIYQLLIWVKNISIEGHIFTLDLI